MIFILNLNDIKKDILTLNKKDSCALYNKSIDSINNNYILSGLNFLKQARDLNPNDVDVLNLIGLVNLLKCNFDESVESFYRSSLCEKTSLCEKYINMLTSEEFLIFFEKYNQLIRLINKGMYQEAIRGFKSINGEYSDLIEPYELLALIYDKEEEYIKFDECLEILKKIDKENYLLGQEDVVSDTYNKSNKQIKSNIHMDIKNHEASYQYNDTRNDDKVEINKSKYINDTQQNVTSTDKKSIKKNKYLHLAIILGILLVGQNIYSSYKMNNLTKQLSKNNSTANQEEVDLSINNKQDSKTTSKDKKVDASANKKNEPSKSNTVKEEVKNTDLFTEDELMSKATTLKKEKKTKSSIEAYKKVVNTGKNKGNLSEATYQIAILSEKLKDYDTAEEYYKMYVENYSEEDSYFDESYYNLGMMYYNKGDVKKSKSTLKKLVNKVPNSMYNNSKVKEILKEE